MDVRELVHNLVEGALQRCLIVASKPSRKRCRQLGGLCSARPCTWPAGLWSASRLRRAERSRRLKQRALRWQSAAARLSQALYGTHLPPHQPG